MKLTSANTKVLATIQAYSKKNQETLPHLIAEEWKKEQGIVDNTNYLGKDEVEIAKHLKKKKQDDKMILGMLNIGERTLLLQKIYDREPQSVKDDLDKWRKAAVVPIEKEGDLLVREAKMLSADK